MKCYVAPLDKEKLKDLPTKQLVSKLTNTYVYSYECEFCSTIKICNGIRENNRKLLKEILSTRS